MYALGHELAQTPAHKFDLAHMRVLLAALGHPENGFPAVLVAGTNGKGSTAATLASILHASGLKTGLYTSPHLVRINERIRLNGEAISDDDFAMLHDVVDRTAERLVGEGDLPWHPSFFEMLTAMGFEYFARSRPDMVVLEVGWAGVWMRPTWSSRASASSPTSRSIIRSIWAKLSARLRAKKRGSSGPAGLWLRCRNRRKPTMCSATQFWTRARAR